MRILPRMTLRRQRTWLRLLALGAGLTAATAAACDFCRTRVQAGIFDGSFLSRLAFLLAPLALTLLAVGTVVFLPRWVVPGADRPSSPNDPLREHA